LHAFSRRWASSRVVRADDAVVDVVALHTMHVGPHDLLIVLAVDFRNELRASELERVVQRLQDRIIEALGGAPNARMIVVEPASRPEAGSRRVAGVRA
jgi:hypothetical protein